MSKSTPPTNIDEYIQQVSPTVQKILSNKRAYFCSEGEYLVAFVDQLI